MPGPGIEPRLTAFQLPSGGPNHYTTIGPTEHLKCKTKYLGAVRDTCDDFILMKQLISGNSNVPRID